METSHWLVWPALAIAIAAVLFGLDRLGLWLEDRGWLYYRRNKPTSSPMTALVAMQQCIEPGIRYVVEVKNHQRSVKEKAADREKVLGMLIEIMKSNPVNVEAIRFYLAWAKEMGLDIQSLY